MYKGVTNAIIFLFLKQNSKPLYCLRMYCIAKSFNLIWLFVVSKIIYEHIEPVYFVKEW